MEQKSIGDEIFPHPKLLITIGSTALLDLSLLIFAVYLIFNIYKLVKFNDIPMLLSIISIALALLCLFIFCVMDIMSFYSEKSYFNTAFGSNLCEQFDSMKVMFIYCAFVFDLYKWCIFIAVSG
jgi:hypothetical protein